MSRIFFYTFLLFFGFGAVMQSKAEEVTLRMDKDWKFRQLNLGEWKQATVPGTVHTDLMEHGIIEDPFYRANESMVQWVDKVNWEYQTIFLASEQLIGQRHQELVFHGLDTWCEVYLNGELLGETNNMFRTWRFDVTGKLKQGENELNVKFYSPIVKGIEAMERYGMVLPASNDYSQYGGMGDVRVSIYMRKAPYHFGWDWGPRLVTSGIWRNVELKGWSDQRITDVYIRQPKVTKQKAELEAEVTFESDKTQSIEVRIENDKKLLAVRKVAVKSGENTIRIPFEIRNPRLWWSVGLGDPYIYDFNVSIRTGNQTKVAKSVKTGLRSIKLVRNKDEKGESFGFELNGIPVFIKGANAIPGDVFLPRMTAERYEKMVLDAVNANMNMIRVWGGGIYEDDHFYETCDKYGIMVWQDFSFACAMYPGDEAFLNNVKQEAIDNIKRLRNHPSLALWCGNNEIDLAWRHDSPGGWGWKKPYNEAEREHIFKAYTDLFHTLLPEVIAEYTDGDDYWPSSPMAGPGINQHNVYTGTSGDNHYWGVWHELHDFERYRDNIGRFMSEYGFQSFPGFETVKQYTQPEDYDITSEVMTVHQRSGIGNLRIKEYMERYYRVPADFEQFLYMSQVLQADAMKLAMQAHRAAMPYCGGSLLWQLNDCWPVASWSTTDYYHTWKAAHYAVREACKPQMIAIEGNDSIVKLIVVNDKLKALSGNYELQLIDFNGKIVNQCSGKVSCKANATQTILTLDSKQFLKGYQPSQVMIVATLKQGNKTVDTDISFVVRPKELEIPKADINAEIINRDGKQLLQVTSNSVAIQVMFYFPGHKAHFEENYVTLLPNRTYEIPFTLEQSAEVKEVKWRCVE